MYQITLVLTLILIASHYLSASLKRIKGLKPTYITSFASGMVVAYVFLHMLPALVESREHIHQLLAKTTYMSPFKDLIVFTEEITLTRQTSIFSFFLGTLLVGFLRAILLVN